MCPRCGIQLIEIDGMELCPKRHGILLKIAEFKQQTSQKFAQFFWSHWIRLQNKKTISCPHCKARMFELNSQAQHPVELDCCLQCFSIWLDDGEGRVLKEIFLKHEDAKQNLKGIKIDTEKWDALGREILKHDATVQRYKRVAKFGEALNTRITPFRRGFVTAGPWFEFF